MPLLEVVYVREEPLPVEQRRAFAREVVEIFRKVLGTPPVEAPVKAQAAARGQA